ncbi:hypothetical protein GGX14DRAFT_595762 [Mycena pura]|uniref:Sc15 protein n=1 Tax=Mycena pura TaxID=153505 RepID=A0AAD6Y3C4_9AGAR|nr:hypothetical protein GGX14DRAFT_595762 [Mycena pura]
MFALRFASILLLVTSFVSAIPAPAGADVEKRSSTANVASVLNTLQGSTNSILPQINSLASSGTASDATVIPLVTQLIVAIDTAHASLGQLSPVPSRKRQSEADLAATVAGVITEITETLNGLPGVSEIPALPTLIIAVDTALQELLVGLDVVVAGILTLVDGLLVSVAVLLNSVGLGLVLILLGL